MRNLVLITGGAGFVGSHLADRLLKDGYRVRVLDSLAEQVHGHAGWPDYLDRRVERVLGDVRDPQLVRESLRGVDAVFHFAAAVGVGQSMYRIEHYVDVNNRGTAVLLEALAEGPVKRLIVASSMSLYGEGLYRDPNGGLHEPLPRNTAALRAAEWEFKRAQTNLDPVPTPETKTPDPSSVYALSKYDQERLCLVVGASLGISTTALRFFNIYGPRQALGNPYTGVLAIFASRLLNGRAPVLFEDGRQRRDFVSVYDVADACLLALESERAAGETFNIGSGRDHRILDVARTLIDVLGVSGVEPKITNEFRVGDIRHCFADIGKAATLLHYQPKIRFEDGVEELAGWLGGRRTEDRVDTMLKELKVRGLSA